MKTGTEMRKILAVLLAGSIVLSFASCSAGGPKESDILDAAEDFADAMKNCDADKIVELSNVKKGSGEADNWEDLFNTANYSDEQNAIAEAIADTIEYEIDEDSLDLDKKEASIDVVFTIVDYQAVLDDTVFFGVDEALSAINDCKEKKEFEMTFEFELDGDDWLVSNLGDSTNGNLYGYLGYPVDIVPDFGLLVDHTETYYDDVYVTVKFYFTEDVSEYADRMQADVYYGDELLEGTCYVDESSEYIKFSYYWNGEDYIDSGTYTFNIKYNGREFASEYVEVDNSWDIALVGGDDSGYGTDVDGDCYIASVDITDQFVESYINDTGYDLEANGTLETDFDLVLNNGLYTISIDSFVFADNMTDYLYDNIYSGMQAEWDSYSQEEQALLLETAGCSSYDELIMFSVEGMAGIYDADDLNISDSGTYTIDGDTIYFVSDSYGSFEGTIGVGGMITIGQIADTSLNNGAPIEFYPEGTN